MAKKKKTNKLPKKKQKARNKKVLIGIFCFLVVTIVAIVFMMYYPTLSSDYKNVDDAILKTDEVLIDKVVTSNLDLLTLVDGNSTIISWESSNPDVISNTGEVTRPSFTEGDKVVSLTATYKIPLKDGIAEVLSSALGYNEKTKTYTVKVKALEATDTEKLELVRDNLRFPNNVYGSIDLPIAFPLFSDVVISWESSNESIFSNEGVYTPPTSDTEITLKATISVGSVVEEAIFNPTVLASPPEVEEVNINFNDMSLTGTRYITISQDNVTFMECKVEGASTSDTDSSETGDYAERYLNLRSTSGKNGLFTSELVNNAKKLTFSYQSARTSGNNKNKLVVYTSSDNSNWTILEEIEVIYDSNYHDINIALSGNVYVKMEFISGYASGTENVYIDNLVITREINESDFINYVQNNIPTSISTYVVLPFTTEFGGSVTYSSSNEEILSDGGVVQSIPENNTKVVLTVIISYLDETYETQIEVTVKGYKESSPIEIYFIDIGKYGQSDCGESIYIKYENIDILIDAADSFDASKQAVKEAISGYLTDGVLDYVIATHPDSDHIGGMPNVFEAFQVENLIVFDGDHTSQKYQNFVTAYTNENCNVINIYDDIIKNNDTILTLSNEVFIEFIDTKYYDENVSEETNGRSIVFLLNAYDTKVLFTGDADSQGAHPDLEENYQSSLGDIDILKVVHHGTREGTGDDYLKAIDPEVAIICNGNYLGNKHSHPHVETITNLYEYDSNMKVYCITGGAGSDGCELGDNGSYKCDSSQYMNDRNGTINLIINNSGYTITSEYYETSPMEVKNTDWWKGYLDTIN